MVCAERRWVSGTSTGVLWKGLCGTNWQSCAACDLRLALPGRGVSPATIAHLTASLHSPVFIQPPSKATCVNRGHTCSLVVGGCVGISSSLLLSLQ